MSPFKVVLALLALAILALAKEPASKAADALQDEDTEGAEGTLAGDATEAKGTPIEPDLPSAYLLVYKQLLSAHLFESRPALFTYTIYNIGDAAAEKVTLTENSLEQDGFVDVHGLTTVYWERIAAGANVTHSIVASPRHEGQSNISHATVTFKPLEDSETFVTVYSTSQSRVPVNPDAVYKRYYETHFVAWFVFVLLCLPVTLLPFSLWRRSASRYEKLVAASTGSHASSTEAFAGKSKRA